jgi:hypothetical protein
MGERERVISPMKPRSYRGDISNAHKGHTMNDLAFGATLLSVSVLLAVALVREAAPTPCDAARPSAWSVAPGPVHVPAAQSMKGCRLLAAAPATVAAR